VDAEVFITILGLGISTVAIILLGAIVLMRSPRERLYQSFFALSLSAALWILTNLVFSVVHMPVIQYLAALLSYGSGGLLGLYFFQYCIGLVQTRVRKSTVGISYAVGLAISAASVIPGVMATGVHDDKILTNPLPLLAYGVYLAVYLGWGLFTLIVYRTKAKGMERRKITIILLGLGVAAVIGLFFNLILPMLGEYHFVKIGPVATLIFVGSSTYAIVRHHLFDIKLAAVRTIAYAGSLLTLSGVYYLFAYILSVFVFNSGVTSSVSISPANIMITLILAFSFQPIKRFFDRTTNNIFYREEYKSENFFSEFSTLLTSTIDLRGLLQRASEQIANTFKAEQAFFFLYYTNTTDHHMSAGTHGHGRMPLYDARLLDEYVAKTGTEIFLTELIADDPAVGKMLKSHRVAVVMPLRRGDDIAGYVMLGEHLTGNFTKRDLTVLSTISNELVIAIQNALSLHEVRELNATLQQRIDVATKELRSSNSQLKHLDEVKDEFMSMASHQLRTPLTSIKGYLSMVLEGDAGRVTAQQHKLLLEAFNSSERMVRLIADFLNVSRLQTGKFIIEKATFDLKKVVEEEVRDLEMIAHTHDVKLRLKTPNQQLPVVADEQKIRQVVMNFIDNAIYYSNLNSTIVINVERVKNEVALTVVDTGIGVPADQQAKLFTKFFRAPNARKQRPDGTGVGLYLARRVINSHNGAIIFSSKEGRGSTFGFRLPLAKLAALPAEKPEPELAAAVSTK
jgi:signal transduction histidine kinase